MVDLNQVKSVAILGDINTGKTNLAVSMLREYKKKGGKREIYLVGYPKQIDDFKNISNFQDLFKLTDSVVFIDEIQKYIKIYDRKANYDLMELISLFAHNNNTLVFTTCFSQFISRSIEGYIDCWDLTRILDLKSLKNGGKAKRIIEQTTHPKCNKWSLALKKGEYLEYSELNDPGDNNVKEFIRHMISYRLGYNEADQLDSQWGYAAAQWWSNQVAGGRRISEILTQDGRTGEVRPLGDLIIPTRLSVGEPYREAACRLIILLLRGQREAVEFAERRCPHCEGESLAISGRDVVRVCVECQQTPIRCTCEGIGRGTLGHYIQYLHYPDVTHIECENCGRREYSDCYVWEDRGDQDSGGFIADEVVNCEECMYRIYEQTRQREEDRVNPTFPLSGQTTATIERIYY